jgi:hypothetical protein
MGFATEWFSFCIRRACYDSRTTLLFFMMGCLFIFMLTQNMSALPSSKQELLALEERIGSVSTALSDEQLAKCLRRSIYCPVATGVNKSVRDDMKCSICQVSSHLTNLVFLWA